MPLFKCALGINIFRPDMAPISNRFTCSKLWLRDSECLVRNAFSEGTQKCNCSIALWFWSTKLAKLIFYKYVLYETWQLIEWLLHEYPCCYRPLYCTGFLLASLFSSLRIIVLWRWWRQTACSSNIQILELFCLWNFNYWIKTWMRAEGVLFQIAFTSSNFSYKIF